MRKGLSKRQQDIYEYICTYSKDHGYAPSVREIGNAVNLASPSTVHLHLKTLQEKGLIRRDPKKPRTIEIVPQYENVEGLFSPEDYEIDPQSTTVPLPLIGNVAAGIPILAEQNVEEVISMPTSIVGNSSSFILRVRGVSMIDVGIMDGDYIIVREQHYAQNGDIVVALIDDSATVKTFYREDNIIRLQPENKSMEPIYIKNPTILGVVTSLVRTIK